MWACVCVCVYSIQYICEYVCAHACVCVCVCACVCVCLCHLDDQKKLLLEGIVTICPTLSLNASSSHILVHGVAQESAP